MRSFVFWLNLTEIVPKGLIDNTPALVYISGAKLFVIIWTKADLVHRYLYVALGGHELNCL